MLGLSWFLPWRADDYESLPPARRIRAQRIAIALWILLVALIGTAIGVTVFLVRRGGPRRAEPPNYENWQQVGEECPRAPANPQDRRKQADQLTVATFNAEWLFMDTCPGNHCSFKTQAEKEDHLQRVATTIYNLNADIVNVVEVESCRTLARLLSLMPAGHGYLPYVIKSIDTATGQTLGLLTRVDPLQDLERSSARVAFPIAGSQCPAVADLSGKTGCSKHYVTRFEVRNSGGRPTSFIMAGVHLLSQPLDRQRCPRREGQATVVKEAVEAALHKYPGSRVIILGDLNDMDNAVAAPGGTLAISGTLPLLRTTGGQRLVSVAERLPLNDRYTAWWDANNNCLDDGGREHSLIDHILVSPGWKISAVKADHSYPVSCKQRVSDHWPLLVQFAL